MAVHQPLIEVVVSSAGDVLPTYLASYLDKIDADGPGFNTLGQATEFVSLHADRTYEHFIQIGAPSPSPTRSHSRNRNYRLLS